MWHTLDALYGLMANIQQAVTINLDTLHAAENRLANVFWRVRRAGRPKYGASMLGLRVVSPEATRGAPRAEWYSFKLERPTKGMEYANHKAYKKRTEHGYDVRVLRAKAMPHETWLIPILEERLVKQRRLGRKLTELRVLVASIVQATADLEDSEKEFQAKLADGVAKMAAELGLGLADISKILGDGSDEPATNTPTGGDGAVVAEKDHTYRTEYS